MQAGLSLSSNELLVSMDPQPLLLDHLSSHSAVPYWIHKGLLSDDLAALVNWSLLNAASSPCPPTYHMWASKLVSGHLAVGITMARWKQWDSPLCPCCKAINESTIHVLQCPHPVRTDKWQNSFQTWLQEANTALSITSWFVTFL